MPTLQAENVSMRMGRMVEADDCTWIGRMARALYMDSITLSKYSRAEISNAILQIKCIKRPPNKQNRSMQKKIPS